MTESNEHVVVKDYEDKFECNKKGAFGFGSSWSSWGYCPYCGDELEDIEIRQKEW